MNVWVLGSGSRGNAVLLDCGESRVLVDAGFAPRELAARLRRVGVAPEAIEAVIVTHEHNDHVRGAAACARRWGWALHASRGTVAACPELADADARAFDAGGTVTLSHMTLETVGVPHDAAEPVALVATATRSGVRVGIAYDMGVVTAPVRRALARVDILVLEANHDEGMLRAGPYPPVVQARIGGSHGHLSNAAAATLARESTHRGLAHIVLAHLSERCNDAAVALDTVGTELRRARGAPQLSAATQDGVCGPFVPTGQRSAAGVQLSLF